MFKPEKSYVQAETPAAQRGTVGAAAERTTVLQEKNEKEKPVAVIVCHGMGQQVPFETIDQVARIIRDEAGKAKIPQPPVSTRVVATTDGESYLPRAEIDVVNTAGERRAIHIYEIYWAPLTEGRVNLKDVHNFLVNAGWSGIQRSFGEMYRWMFNDWQALPTGRIIVFKFILALLVFWALTLMSTTIVAVAAAKTVFRGQSNWPSDALLVDLTIDFLIFAAVTGALALMLFLAKGLHHVKPASTASEVANKIGWFLVWLTIITAIVVGVLILVHLRRHWGGSAGPYWTNRLARSLSESSGWSAAVILVVWFAVGYINKRARDFFLQFVGDVAAYISPHSVNKFYEIRRNIQQNARSVAQAVYSMKNEAGTLPLYDRVVFMGHSLGSVIAYDTLNQMLLHDQLFARGALRVHARTTTLLTFGSPLDKTAFVFREQQPLDAQVREALAAVHQPLIATYDLRPASWINVYSPADWISGPLDYYDEDFEHRNKTPQFDKLRVKNEKDLDSSVPLLAHTMYWGNPLLAEKLFKAVTEA